MYDRLSTCRRLDPSEIDRSIAQTLDDVEALTSSSGSLADVPETSSDGGTSGVVLGERIGPVTLGDSLSDAQEALEAEGEDLSVDGLPLGLHEWEVPGGLLQASIDQSDRVVGVSTTSDRYKYDGIGLGSDFEEVRQALPGGEVAECQGGRAIVRREDGGSGPYTEFLFSDGGNELLVTSRSDLLFCAG
jgi:hypothetical protein